MPKNTFMSCASNVKLHISPVNSVPLKEVLQELLVWIKARNETAGMSLSFRTEELYKLLQLLGGRALRIFILGQIYPNISFLSLSSSFYPLTLTIQPSPGSSERDPGGASKDNLG